MKKYKYVVLALFVIALISVVGWYLHNHNVAVLDPAGPIARKERNLIILACLLAILVVVPVFSLTIFIAWKYRESNKRHKDYRPDWDHSRLYEGLWWGVPSAIILVLSIVTWNSSHTLDPYRPLADTANTLNVQVIALDWKWLFIYPKQNIASVSMLELPVNTAVTFHITSDTVMNSFWIPNLGSQIYAMPGMDTQLNLEADKLGSFPGSSANISGSGFADMTFTAKSVSMHDFNSWVASVQQNYAPMNLSDYTDLSDSSVSNTPQTYAPVVQNLYYSVLEKYMPAMPPVMTKIPNGQPYTQPPMSGMGMM